MGNFKKGMMGLELETLQFGYHPGGSMDGVGPEIGSSGMAGPAFEKVEIPIFSGRDHVKVPIPDQGLTPAMAFKLRGHIGHARFLFDDFGRETAPLEIFGNQGSALPNIPGRVQPWGTNQPAEEIAKIIRIDEFLEVGHFSPRNGS